MREKSNHKHGRFVLDSSNLLYATAFTEMKDFHYKSIT